MSTLESSSALPTRSPRPPVPAVPTFAIPAEALSPYRFDPSFTRPCGLLKFASASWPTVTVVPAPNDAWILPAESMVTPELAADCDPLDVIEEVADGDAKPVRDGTVGVTPVFQMSQAIGTP